jgi:hypothetical protein
MINIALLVDVIIYRAPTINAPVLLKDTVVLWFVNLTIFGVWYWLLDGGGPQARRDGANERRDLVFPQHAMDLSGWGEWRPGLIDYLFLGFNGNAQFGFGDTMVFSRRVKILLMLQITLSMSIMVFLATFAISLLH